MYNHTVVIKLCPKQKYKTKPVPVFPRNHRCQGNVTCGCRRLQIIYIDKPHLSQIPHRDFVLSQHIFLTLIICSSSFTHTLTCIHRANELSVFSCVRVHAQSMPSGKSTGRLWVHAETESAGAVRKNDLSGKGEVLQCIQNYNYEDYYVSKSSLMSVKHFH